MTPPRGNRPPHCAFSPRTKAAAFASCADVSYLYKTELTEFAEMVRESRLPRPRCELLKPVIIEHAIEESYKTGKTVAVTL